MRKGLKKKGTWTARKQREKKTGPKVLKPRNLTATMNHQKASEASRKQSRKWR